MSHYINPANIVSGGGPFLSGLGPIPGYLLQKNAIKGPTTARTVLDPFNIGGYQQPTPAPGPPTQDTAANNAQAQIDMLRRRRGVLSNIFAGGNAAAPAVTKPTLGN